MIVFVGSNPSYVGPNSKAIREFHTWLVLMNVRQYRFVNVSTKVTPGNRPLKKSEFELQRLAYDIYSSGATRIVALGNTAAAALDKLKVGYFKLPHPSPRNRKLNDKSWIGQQLAECRWYLENELEKVC